MAESYDFHDFLARMAKLDYHEILRQAEAECQRVEKVSYGVRGAPRQRKFGSVQYASRIKAFLFFMRHHHRPGSASDSEFRSYRDVVKALVQKGEFKPEALYAFK